MDADRKKSVLPWVWLALAAAQCAAMAFLLRRHGWSDFWVWYLAGTVVVTLASRSLPIVFESAFIILVWYLAGGSDCLHPAVPLLPLVAMTLAVTAFETGSRAMNALVLPACAAWLAAANGPDVTGVGWYGWAIIAATLVQLLLNTADGARAPRTRPKVIDLVLCSYSGNTAHYAKAFGEGMKVAGAEVRLHRFHFYPDFDEPLDGDALVLAFPVIGWKPPWTMVAWMLFRMPRGNGRPAFILYTCAGGPENTGLVTWLLLRARGWRPVGRAWSVYPVNVPTFRLGPAFVWRFLDRIVPFMTDVALAARYGEAFARGLPAGQPHLVWAFPLFIIGPFSDNKYINIFPYRNYAWRRRCNACGLCVRYCPVKRLTMRDGFPRASGTCTLCFGCVNLCPVRAMQLVCWTEYGNTYPPRFRELVVKRQQKSRATTEDPA